jgi:hypothetical protein
MQASEHNEVESQLLAYVRQLERNYFDWRAVHLHLSCLKPHNRREKPGLSLSRAVPFGKDFRRFPGIGWGMYPGSYHAVPGNRVANRVARLPR